MAVSATRLPISPQYNLTPTIKKCTIKTPEGGLVAIPQNTVGLDSVASSVQLGVGCNVVHVGTSCHEIRVRFSDVALGLAEAVQRLAERFALLSRNQEGETVSWSCPEMHPLQHTDLSVVVHDFNAATCNA
jgi:hypothetical protein